MKEELKEILSTLTTDVDQELLSKYLKNQLSEKQAHDFETRLMQDPFAEAAFDGLAEFSKTKNIDVLNNDLNKSLKKQLKKKRKENAANKNVQQQFIIYAIIIILLLCLVAWFVVYKMQKG